MTWLEQFAVIFFTTFCSVFALMLASRHRWIKWGEWLQTEEMAKLQAQMSQLADRLAKTETILADTRTERDTLRFELLTALRKIDGLQERIQELEDERAHRRGIRVMGVWPPNDGPALDIVGEISGIYNAGFDYIPVTGMDATKSNVIHHLHHDEPTILEIGAHAKMSGVPLADGLAAPGWWERILRDRNSIRIVVLLACYSDNALYDSVRRALPHARIISVVGEISDKAAVAFIKAFYANYANDMEYTDAVKEAKLVIDYAEASKIRER